MRKVIVAEFITLDGFIAKENGDMDFFNSFNDKEMYMDSINTQQGWGTLLLGRVTFQTMAGFWANIATPDEPIAHFMNTVPKVVVSKSLKDASWGKNKNTTVINDNLEQKVQKLKEQKDKDIAVLGSATLIPSLINKDLVDELFLLVYPITIGKGLSFYNKIQDKHLLNLVESKTYKNGVVMLRYEIL